MGKEARRRDMLSQPGSATLADSQRQRTSQSQNGEGQMWMLESRRTTKADPPFRTDHADPVPSVRTGADSDSGPAHTAHVSAHIRPESSVSEALCCLRVQGVPRECWPMETRRLNHMFGMAHAHWHASKTGPEPNWDVAVLKRNLDTYQTATSSFP